MSILVTGSKGHIGSLLMEALPDDTFGVDVKPAIEENFACVDVRDVAAIENVFGIHAPKLVYHLAGRVGRVVCEQSVRATIESNLLGTLSVARLCTTMGARMIHVSSSEASYTGGKGANIYGLSKAWTDHLLAYLGANYGLEVCVVRPFMMYGEGEDPGKHRSAMIHFAHAIANREWFSLHEGTERGWLHYDDAIRFLVELGQTANLPAQMDIGHPDIRPMRELVQLMEKELDREALFQTVPLPKRMTAVKRPDLHHQISLGLEPTVSLEDGVARVCRGIA